MRPLPSACVRAVALASLLLTAPALPGCLYDDADTRLSAPGTYVPPGYPAGAKVFVLDLTSTFGGELVDVRLDGVRVVRKAVANSANPALAERLRVAATPGLHELFVRVTTAGGRIDQTMPIRVGTELCGGAALVPASGTQAASLRIWITPNDACPAG